MSRIISYRGLLASGGQDTINLHTNDGKTGYKIVKFQIILGNPTAESSEAIVKIFKIKQTTITDLIDFSDGTLLGAGFWTNEAAAHQNPEDVTIVFDNETFNQDIYITYVDSKTTTGVNYYIELEQIDLTEDQALVAIVKNLRNEQ
jgi:hypothetical protein